MKYAIKEVVLDTGVEGIRGRLESADRAVASCRERLMMLAAATPRTVEDVEGNPMEWDEHAQFQVNQILEELAEALWERRLAEIAIENPEDVEEIRG